MSSNPTFPTIFADVDLAIVSHFILMRGSIVHDIGTIYVASLDDKSGSVCE